MIVNKEDQEKLIKRQMKTIDNLQEIINLLKFDLSQIRKENQMIGECMNPVKRLIQFGKKLL